MNLNMDEIELFIEDCIRSETTEVYRTENSNMYSFLGIELEGPLPNIKDLPIKTNIMLKDFKIENKYNILKEILNENDISHYEIIVFDEIHPYITYKSNHSLFNNIIYHVMIYVRMEILYYIIKEELLPDV